MRLSAAPPRRLAARRGERRPPTLEEDATLGAFHRRELGTTPRGRGAAGPAWQALGHSPQTWALTHQPTGRSLPRSRTLPSAAASTALGMLRGEQRTQLTEWRCGMNDRLQIGSVVTAIACSMATPPPRFGTSRTSRCTRSSSGSATRPRHSPRDDVTTYRVPRPRPIRRRCPGPGEIVQRPAREVRARARTRLRPRVSRRPPASPLISMAVRRHWVAGRRADGRGTWGHGRG